MKERKDRSFRRIPMVLALLAAAPLGLVVAVPTASAAAGSSHLEPGKKLTAGQILKSPSGAYKLLMQPDGNLVLYSKKGPLWASGTSGPGNYAVMQGDGNFVVYTADRRPAWYSGTWDAPGAGLTLQDDGNLVLYRAGKAIWHTHTYQRNSSLTPGKRLTAGQSISSKDGRYTLVMQADGHLVLYSRTGPRWASNTPGAGNYVVMQGDGNLVIYTAKGKAKWSSNTHGRNGAQLVLQSDGNLVLYRGKTAIWHTHTGELPTTMHGGELLQPGQQCFSSDGRHRIVMQGDGNLVLYGPSGALWDSSTQGAGNYAAMQADGNFVVYDANGRPKWASNTAGHPGATARVGNDGKVKVVRDGHVLWQGSKQAPTPVSPPAGNIVSATGPNNCTIKVDASIRGAVESLLKAAHAAGKPMCGWGFRDAQQQIDLRRQNCGPSAYEIWEKPANTCSPPTAPPGRSLHERGLAIDFYIGGAENAQKFGGAQLAWMHANAATFGLHNLPSEPWHWSTSGN